MVASCGKVPAVGVEIARDQEVLVDMQIDERIEEGERKAEPIIGLSDQNVFLSVCLSVCLPLVFLLLIIIKDIVSRTCLSACVRVCVCVCARVFVSVRERVFACVRTGARVCICVCMSALYTE